MPHNHHHNIITTTIIIIIRRRRRSSRRIRIPSAAKRHGLWQSHRRRQEQPTNLLLPSGSLLLPPPLRSRTRRSRYPRFKETLPQQPPPPPKGKLLQNKTGPNRKPGSQEMGPAHRSNPLPPPLRFSDLHDSNLLSPRFGEILRCARLRKHWDSDLRLQSRN